MRHAGLRTTLAGAAAVGIMVSQALPGTAQTGLTLSSGKGEASGVFTRIEEPNTFVPDTILAPPEISMGYARAEVDRTGTGAGLAALGFSEYANVLGAVPELGPAFLPPEALPVFELFLEVMPPGLADSVKSLTQASVRGQPPKAADSTYSPSGAVEGGVMRAEVTEGPVAHATSSYSSVPGSVLLRGGAVTTEATITTVGRGRKSEVVSVLRDLTIAEIIEIDSVRVTATALADGAEGTTAGGVVIDGVTVGGLPAVINQDGIRLLDEVVPLGIDPLAAALEAAGIEFVAPGSVEQSASGEAASVTAVGPTLQVTTAEGQTVRTTLGRAVASSSLLVRELPPPPPPPADTGGPTITSGGTSTGADTTTGTTTTSTPPPSIEPPSATTPESPMIAAPGSDGAPTDPATVLVADLERLILGADEKVSGTETIYLLLFLPMAVIGAAGLIRPWGRD